MYIRRSRSFVCASPTHSIFAFRVPIERAEYLGSLLRGWCSVHILSNIGSIVECSRTALNTFPNLPGRRGSGLRTDEGVDSCLQLSELAFDEGALSESGSEEGGVDGDQNPRTLAECDGGEEESAPEKDFEDGDESHGRIIVLLNELPNGVGCWVGLVCGLRSWGCAGYGSHLLGWLQSWYQVCASVGCDVEDRVDAEGEHCKGVLRGEEPDKCHSYYFVSAVSNCEEMEDLPRYWTFSSDARAK